MPPPPPDASPVAGRRLLRLLLRRTPPPPLAATSACLLRPSTVLLCRAAGWHGHDGTLGRRRAITPARHENPSSGSCWARCSARSADTTRHDTTRCGIVPVVLMLPRACAISCLCHLVPVPCCAGRAGWPSITPRRRAETRRLRGHDNRSTRSDDATISCPSCSVLMMW
jgi:hypothetical protein